ncbi:MAG: hypothetical protein ACFHXK_03510 [bacterium]
MNTRKAAFLIAGCTVVIAVFVLLDRNSLIALISLLAGIALVLKAWLRPAEADLAASMGIAAVAALAWLGTWLYVLSTYESGEVIELIIDTSKGRHTARVWVFEMDSDSTVYYDAEPEVAESLLMGRPLQLLRGGNTSTRIPDAMKVDLLTEAKTDDVFTAMHSKYGKRMGAADIYYILIGSPRDSEALVINLGGL